MLRQDPDHNQDQVAGTVLSKAFYADKLNN